MLFSWLLVFASVFTSFIAGIFGMGGGLILITLLPGIVPTAAIIPVHASVQWVSNVSRVVFSWRDCVWRFFTPFFLGSVLGAFLGARIFLSLSEQLVITLMALLILSFAWLPPFQFTLNIPGRFFWLGCLQTFLGSLVGATGPLGGALLLREGLPRDALVVTLALFMAVSHALKIVAYLALGFNYQPYLLLIGAMAIAVTMGSWLASYGRQWIPDVDFKRYFRWLLTALVLRMLWNAWF